MQKGGDEGVVLAQEGGHQVFQQSVQPVSLGGLQHAGLLSMRGGWFVTLAWDRRGTGGERQHPELLGGSGSVAQKEAPSLEGFVA